MRTILLPTLFAVASCSAAGFTVTERGPDHRILERSVEQEIAPGRTIQKKSQVIELGTDMHRLVDGQWVECRNTIELINRNAVARHTRLPSSSLLLPMSTPPSIPKLPTVSGFSVTCSG